MSIILRKWKESKINRQLNTLIKVGLADEIVKVLTSNEDFKLLINDEVTNILSNNDNFKSLVDSNVESYLDDYVAGDDFTNLVKSISSKKTLLVPMFNNFINFDYSLNSNYHLFRCVKSGTGNIIHFTSSLKLKYLNSSHVLTEHTINDMILSDDALPQGEELVIEVIKMNLSILQPTGEPLEDNITIITISRSNSLMTQPSSEVARYILPFDVKSLNLVMDETQSTSLNKEAYFEEVTNE